MSDRTQPGVHKNADGTVTLKFKSDKQQLESIADWICANHPEDKGNKLNAKDTRALIGYAEQLRIIADRMLRGRIEKLTLKDFLGTLTLAERDELGALLRS
jgi:hypothetical protein